LLAGAAAGVVVLVLLAGGVHHAHAGAAAQTTATVPVHVGVILDLGTGLGKKSLLSLEMALEDFYAAHPAATTRVSLHVKDSERDVAAAAAGIYWTADIYLLRFAACDI
jgi:ionotropic glutamate receptor